MSVFDASIARRLVSRSTSPVMVVFACSSASRAICPASSLTPVLQTEYWYERGAMFAHSRAIAPSSIPSSPRTIDSDSPSPTL